ncbi:MAG: mechanosensitive ion channel family protein [Chloroflexota bacterium]|nr:mechanosensitive ion channel family protein [Chloroflexota bacterium]
MMDAEALRATLVEYLIRTLWALVVVIVAIVVARATRGTATRALGRHRAHPNVVVLLGNLAQLTVLVFGALGVLAIYTQGSFGWILTSFSVIGLVVGLSLQDILRNFFAGIYVLVERPFRIGDTVQVAEHTGIVEEISFRTTQLRTDDGREVVVPNATLMTSPVVNLTRYANRSAKVTVTVPAREATAETANLLRDLLGRSEAIARDPAPAIQLRGLSGGHATYELTVWGPDRERAAGDAVTAILASGTGWDVQVA